MTVAARVATVRLAWGMLLLARPDAVVRAFGGRPGDRPARIAARLLGARHVVQGLMPPGRRLAMVDALHGASMLAVAAVDRPRARLGLTDAAIASLFAVSGLLDSGRSAAL